MTNIGDTTRFTHEVTSSGPAQGMTFTGRRRFPEPAASSEDVPLVIAVHGGGYTSAYFDVPGYSLLDRAAGIGVPIIAVDRPGYGGSTPAPPGDSVFLANAAVLDHLIAELWAANAVGSAGVFVIGHSIGAAITMALAARKPDWPLLGIAVSGCLLREPEGLHEAWAAYPGATLNSPAEVKAANMFGPEWTFRDDMPKASYFANAPVLRSELVEASSAWQDIFRDIAPEISVPAHIRLGQFDKLWIFDEDEVAAFGAALTSAPLVDAQISPYSGHAIDYHREGAAFQIQQLSFAINCSASRIAEGA
jgi:pimeloyl-ACP methyl ester carboxylesterase